MKRLTLLAATALAAVLTTVVSAQASISDPYVTKTGYDAASGNCPATPPGSQYGYNQFAVLNTTGGRPFTANSCLGQEISSARAGSAAISFYFNTGYVGAYGRDVTSSCNALASQKYSGKAAQAYAIGCSEFDYAQAQAGAAVPQMWWLDVETGNSWSSSSQALNRDTIQGALDEGHAAGATVGVYSSIYDWQRITGGVTSLPVDADWGLVNDYGWNCPATGFTGSPVWLLQGGTTQNGMDADTGC